MFNSPDKVSTEARDRVYAAAAELGWIPNEAGRTLASSRSRMVGVIIPTLDDEIFAHQVHGLQEVLSQHGMTLIIGCSNYDGTLALSEAQAMLARGIEALALVGEAHRPELFGWLDDRDVPYVLMYTYRTDSPHPCVGFDNAAAFRQLTERLIALGHRDFRMILQPRAENDRVLARLHGVREALATHGLTLPERYVLEGPGTIEAGERSFTELFGGKAAARPTAVICGNDHLALGAMFAARRLGIDIPGEVSLTGFDDLRISSRMTPALTTVRVDNRRIGEIAAAHLITAIESGSRVLNKELAPEFKYRESHGPAKKCAPIEPG